MCFFSSQDVFNRAHSESYVLPSLPQTGVTIFTFAFLHIPLQEQCSCDVPWITDLWHDSPNLHDSFPHLSKRKPVGRRTIGVQIFYNNILYITTVSIYVEEKFPLSNLRPSHPLGEICVSSGHISHLSPLIPGLHIHFPDICSQSFLTEP